MNANFISLLTIGEKRIKYIIIIDYRDITLGNCFLSAIILLSTSETNDGNSIDT